MSTDPRPRPPAQPVLRHAPFAELTPFEVYRLCRLRVDVFVVEQQCPYPELDGRDLEPATLHLWLEADGEVAGDHPHPRRRADPRDRARRDGARSPGRGWPRG